MDASAPTLAASTVTATLAGDALAFYQSAPGTGISQATLSMPSELALASVVVMVNGAFRGLSDETTQPARVMTGSLASGDTTFVVVDYVVDISPSPTMYGLTVNTTNL